MYQSHTDLILFIVYKSRFIYVQLLNKVIYLFLSNKI